MIDSGLTQDPGKDIFAFLFIMNMLFTSMLVVGSNSLGTPTETPPGATGARGDAAQTIDGEKAGVIQKEGSRLWLVYQNDRYQPGKDIKRLIEDGHVFTEGTDKNKRQVLYILDNGVRDINLSLYFKTFRPVQQAGVGVVFVRRGD